MPRNSTNAPTPTAYSYIRFSSPEQSKGDSLRRQTERAADICERRGWRLDTALTLRDLGVSAFRGANALTGNLGTFLSAIERGTVPPGSVLIVESFDRISRQGIDEGYEIVKRILKKDVRIVTLSPEREFDREATKSLSKGALEIQLILERAAEESERKSDRVGAAWAQKRKDSRAGVVMTSQLPAWVCQRGDKLALIPDAAAAVRRVFELATAGYGVPSILRALARERVPAIGKSGRWTRAYVGLILRDSRVTGAYQPRRSGAKDGAVVEGYYPAAVTGEQWLAARSSIRERSRFRGRVGARGINIFAGLIRHARAVGDMFQMTQRVSAAGGKARRYSILVNTDGEDRRTRAYSFPYERFEAAFLEWFRGIDAAAVLPGNGEADATARLAAALEMVEVELSEAAAYMNENGFSAAIGKRVTVLEDRQRDLAADLAEARQRAAHPLGESWGQAVTLADYLAKADDTRDTRIRLRSVLRAVVESIHLLLVPHGRQTLAVAQCVFAGGNVRYLWVNHSRAGNARPEDTETWESDRAGIPPVDLRDPAAVAGFEKSLARFLGAAG